MTQPKLPPRCKECGFLATPSRNHPDLIICGCSRCRSVRANGFCNSNCENAYHEEKAYRLERMRRGVA